MPVYFFLWPSLGLSLTSAVRTTQGSCSDFFAEGWWNKLKRTIPFANVILPISEYLSRDF
jgi:hypothetical protein